MSILKKGIAMLMSVMLMLPMIPVSAAEVNDSKTVVSQDETLSYNLGSNEIELLSPDNKKTTWDELTNETNVYVIEVEQDAFFPYEVQFTYNGETIKKWFMSQDDIVEIGDYQFGIHSDVTGTMVTEMTLDIAGKKVVVYPKEKAFTSGKMQLRSLLPITEQSLEVDLTGFTPVELTRVSLSSVVFGEEELGGNGTKVSFKRLRSNDDYECADLPGDAFLNVTGGSTVIQWEMIVGTIDQLDENNVRYIVTGNKSYPYNWLTASVYSQQTGGERVAIDPVKCHYSVYEAYDNVYISIPQSLMNNTNIYFTFHLSEPYSAKKIKAYEGKHTTETELNSAREISDKIFCADMSQENAGYLLERSDGKYITLVSLDENEKITGIRPVHVGRSYLSNGLVFSGIYSENERVSYSWTSSTMNNVHTSDFKLSKGNSANLPYSTYANFYANGSLDNSKVTAAYVGTYNTIAEAQAADATDVKDELFNDSRKYTANFSNGVYFTIFAGEDNSEDREVFHEFVKVTEGTVGTEGTEDNEVVRDLYSGTAVTFTGLKDAVGNGVDAYCVPRELDSYGNYNFRTILVDDTVDVSSLAPEFTTSEGVNLYATGANTPEVSGISVHDFSKGILQYSADAENGSDSANYWLQIVKKSSGLGQLYMNSLADAGAGTRTAEGVVYSTREVIIDSLHNYRHDILLANIGTNKIDKLSVELTSDTVALDQYWTLSGNHDLSGFSTIQKTKTYGELANLAMLRLKLKNGVTEGSDINGTLTIKSDNTPLMVITLTGTVGNPCITTTDVPQAVKYVPYGTMIQNNNKYNWNKPTYELVSGTLPSGMELRESGVLYGVPKENGTFTFTVKMKNSYSSFSDSQQQLTLTILDNTDANVDAATDTGYDVTTRIADISSDDSAESYLFVSQGEFGEFADIYIDGNKLVKDMDYSAESGSTRLTIKAQTLKRLDNGTHTIGVEFKTGEKKEQVKRAAQNVKVKKNYSGSNSGGGSTGNNSGGGSTGNNSNNNSTGNNKENDSTDTSTDESDKTSTKPSESDTNTDLQNAVQAVKRVVTVKQTNDSKKRIVSWLDKSGKTIKNSFVITLKGNTVYVDKNGAMKQGIGFTANGKRYYASASGAIVKNGFFETELGNTVYATKSGELKAKTVFKVNGKQYVAKKSGALVKSKWYTIGKKKYYCDKNGVVKDIKEA